jgi:circadian clock protein KaiC
MLQTERVSTGIAGLDRLLDGGFPKGRSVLVTGEPGTGKTIMALQFLADGLDHGEKCVYVAADEGPLEIIEQAVSIGWDFEKFVEQKQLAILNAGTYLNPAPAVGRERDIDVHKALNELAGFVNRLGAKRMVLDPAAPFLLIRDGATRIQDQARLLIKLLRSSTETTNMLTCYATPRTGERFMHGIEEYLVAGAIVLEMIWGQDRFARTLVVEKMRCTNVKPAQIEFDIIKGHGIVLNA